MTELLRIRCRTPDEARRVIALLLRRRVPSDGIEVLSAEPLHDLGAGLAGKTRLPVFVVVGAAVGAAGGYALGAVTARAYPISTGGMPIVAPLPIGIIAYEAMMLLAVLFTLAAVLLEGRLGRRRPPESDRDAQALLDGEVHVLAVVPTEEEAESLRVAIASARSEIEV